MWNEKNRQLVLSSKGNCLKTLLRSLSPFTRLQARVAYYLLTLLNNNFCKRCGEGEEIAQGQGQGQEQTRNIPVLASRISMKEPFIGAFVIGSSHKRASFLSPAVDGVQMN